MPEGRKFNDRPYDSITCVQRLCGCMNLKNRVIVTVELTILCRLSHIHRDMHQTQSSVFLVWDHKLVGSYLESSSSIYFFSIASVMTFNLNLAL